MEDQIRLVKFGHGWEWLEKWSGNDVMSNVSMLRNGHILLDISKGSASMQYNGRNDGHIVL